MGVELWANHMGKKSEVLFIGSILGNKLGSLLGAPWEHDGNTLRTRKKNPKKIPSPLLKRKI